MIAETCWVNKMIEHGRVIFDVFSSHHIVMGYRLDSWASIPGKGKRFFSSPQGPASYTMGTRGFLL
jgi:hypothetical protein